MSLLTLPPELLHAILKRFTPTTLSSVASVCTSLRKAALDPSLWRPYLLHSSSLPPSLAYRVQRAWHLGRALPRTIPLPLTPDSIAISQHLIIVASIQPTMPISLPSVLLVGPPNTCAVSVRARFLHQKPYMAVIYPKGHVVVYAVNHNNYSSVLSTTFPVLPTQIDIILLKEQLVLVTATAAGEVFLKLGRKGNATCVKVSVRAVTSLNAEGNEVYIGTEGGEVIAINISDGWVSKRYIGTCDCPVSGLAVVAKDVVVAGYKHRVAGNGHSNVAVAWERVRGIRMKVFRCAGGRGGSFVMDGVGRVAADDHRKRIAVVMRRGLRVYGVEEGRWELSMEDVKGDVGEVRIDCKRLVVAVKRASGGGAIEIVDFEAAVKKSLPQDAKCFLPN